MERDIGAQRRYGVCGNREINGLAMRIEIGLDGDVEVVERDVAARVEVGQVADVEIGLAYGGRSRRTGAIDALLGLGVGGARGDGVDFALRGEAVGEAVIARNHVVVGVDVPRNPIRERSACCIVGNLAVSHGLVE